SRYGHTHPRAYIGHPLDTCVQTEEIRMARMVRDAQLGSRAARKRRAARGKPHWRAIDPGLHIGYRKPVKGAGRWVVRLYGGRQTYETATIAVADDISDANCVDVLS